MARAGRSTAEIGGETSTAARTGVLKVVTLKVCHRRVALKSLACHAGVALPSRVIWSRRPDEIDRKSTRLNSSHRCISYAVFCLIPPQPRPTLFPYTTLFRSNGTSWPQHG